MITPIHLRYEAREINFSMDLDEACPMEKAVLHYLKAGIPCEPETVNVMLRAIRPGDTVVDAGANIGFFTLLMSMMVGPTGKVIAFEPCMDNRLRLYKNLKLNGCTNVRVVEEPLWWHASGKVQMYSYEDGGSNSLWPMEGADLGGEWLRTTTLDRECTLPVRLIKLDIEGAESAALRGGSVVLDSAPIIITEINETALRRAEISVEQLRAQLCEFRCFALSEAGDFPSYIPAGVRLTPRKPNTNVLFCQMAQVQQLWPEAFA